MRRLLSLVGLCAALGLSAAVASAVENHALPTGQTTLLDKWFKLQDSGPVYAPYAFIEKNTVQAEQNARKKPLLASIDNLIWRLQAAGQGELATALSQWRRHIATATRYRSPGHWGPTALLSGTADIDIDSVAALGACAIPNWIEIWSAAGVRRLLWQPHMRLVKVLARNGAANFVDTDSVTLVTPYGMVVRRAVGTLDQQDTQLLPGMRMVVPIPLGPQASDWLVQSLGAFLSHLQPGDDCRLMQVHATASQRDG